MQNLTGIMEKIAGVVERLDKTVDVREPLSVEVNWARGYGKYRRTSLQNYGSHTIIKENPIDDFLFLQAT